MNFKTMRRNAMLLTCFLTAGLLKAQIPNLINYQGKITVSGAPGSGSFSITFTIYPSATSATVLFAETQTVPVTNGVFNVLLGDKTTGGIPSSVFTGSGDRYLGVKVGTDPEISPRFRLTSVAFAIRANEADGVADNAVGPADLADNAVTAQKIAANNVVKSINSLRDNVTIAPGANVTITPSGNTLTIAASGGPLAYAFINWSGAVIRGTPNVTSTYNATNGYYEITIAGESYFFSNYATIVTPLDAPGNSYIAGTSSVSGKLLIAFTDKTGAQVQLPAPFGFQFVTYKLP